MASPGVVVGGRYRLVTRVATGPVGEVWRAVDEMVDRVVAVKTFDPTLLDEPGFPQRFVAEARMLARLQRPGMVALYDVGIDGGLPYVVTEFIDGESLAQELARVGRVKSDRAMALIARVADVLHAAHETGVVHRDLKPGNVLVRPDATVVLTDFAVSGAVGIAGPGRLVIGDAPYISPEAAAGDGPSPLSNVYELGVLAYRCLAGHPPFEAENPLEVAMRHIVDAAPPLPLDVPPRVREVVGRALAKRPGSRWPTAAAFAAAARAAMVAAPQIEQPAITWATATAGRVYICYRREDVEWVAGRISDRLIGRLGSNLVAMDVAVGVEPEAVASSEFVLVLIGPRWLTGAGPGDRVRVAVEAALALGKRIIPALLPGATMPSATDLPPSLAGLLRYKAIRVNHTNFDETITTLVRLVRRAAR